MASRLNYVPDESENNREERRAQVVGEAGVV